MLSNETSGRSMLCDESGGVAAERAGLPWSETAGAHQAEGTEIEALGRSLGFIVPNNPC